jgi:hypothetical protein
LGGFFHQLAAETAAPEFRLDERAVELGIAVVARDNHSKARGGAPVLDNDDEAGRDLFGGKLYIGMEKFGLAFIPPLPRAALQLFQRFALGRMRGAN